MTLQAIAALHSTASLEAHSPARREIYIVGDKFVDYARENPHVMTAQEFELLLENGRLQAPLDVTIAQGVAAERLAQLEDQLNRSRLKDLVRIKEARPRQRASGKLTHKQNDENTIISQPTRKEGEALFEAHLILDDNSSEMIDHLVGQHIQGIVFYEAARQMTLAVAEEFLLQGGKVGRKCYFVVNQFNIAHHMFGFPLPTDIQLEVKELRGNVQETEGMFMDVQVRFYQAGAHITDARIKCAFFEEAMMSAREGLMARMALAKVVPTMAPVSGWEL